LPMREVGKSLLSAKEDEILVGPYQPKRMKSTIVTMDCTDTYCGR
jgi:hypothetical protein